jgi:hypothetical protein
MENTPLLGAIRLSHPEEMQKGRRGSLTNWRCFLDRRRHFGTLGGYMPNKIIGVVVHSDYVDLVLLQQNAADSFSLDDETALSLQTGERPAAYHILHGQFLDYVQQHQATCVCIKQSALSTGATKMVHLMAAELRGVVQAAAAASGVGVRLFNKSSVSRTFGDRKVDEYLKDHDYWDGIGLNSLKKGMREAAFAAVAMFS